MTRLRAALLAPALFLAVGAPTGAYAANRFDGAWSVIATAESGSCTGPYSYPIVIRDGTVIVSNRSKSIGLGVHSGDAAVQHTIKSHDERPRFLIMFGRL
ncbi:hypothetical protein [Methylobacterium sp. B1]|uniref:hypothetical protein n=1 Tax=Methylobacterium sp. B1 TaxID=91459 RepID=UPI000A017AD3|nr:hypothetical protein [Methylobacterium sp. B1]